MNQKKNNGFTLIELMIVVAIIGILASIALPAYQAYTVRAQVSESMMLIGELKFTVAEYYKERGRFPASNDDAGIPKKQFLQGNYVSQVELENGAFHVTLGNKVNQAVVGKVVSIRPIIVKGSPASPFSWVCGYSPIPPALEATTKNRTSADKTFLPTACRL